MWRLFRNEVVDLEAGASSAFVEYSDRCCSVVHPMGVMHRFYCKKMFLSPHKYSTNIILFRREEELTRPVFSTLQTVPDVRSDDERRSSV